MIAHYIKVAFRYMQRQKLYAFLNITGLATGLAAGILILLWVSHEMSFDHGHTRLKQLQVLLQHQTYNGETFTFFAMPGPLAADLKKDFPEIVHAARTSFVGPRLLRTDRFMFNEASMYADPEFFDMFDFPAVAGDPKAAAADPGSAIITERLARKLFGDASPIGQPLQINNRFDYRVAAVLRDIPENSSMQFDLVLPFTIFEKASTGWIYGYGTNSLMTYIETRPDANLDALNERMKGYFKEKRSDSAAQLFAWPMSKWRLESQFKEGKPAGGRIRIVHLFLIIGIAIIAVACINFMNLSTARSAGRAREVGVRKAMGAPRRRIIAQFMGEAMLMVLVALALAVIMAIVSLPLFNEITGKHLTLAQIGPAFWAGIALLGFVTALAAGAYPAFYLSRFQPVRVLKGQTVTGQRSGVAWLRKGLVVAQFTFSIALIIASIVIKQQIDFARSMPLGYAKDHLLYLPARGEMSEQFPAFQKEVAALSGVQNVAAAADNLLEYGSNTGGIDWPGKSEDNELLITVTSVGAGFLETAGIKMKEGRSFRAETGVDDYSVIINETAARRMGLEHPVGQVIQYDTARTIIGVVADFVYNNIMAEPAPMVMILNQESSNNYFIRLNNDGQMEQKTGQIEQIFKKCYPQHLFDPQFVDEGLEKQFDQIKVMGTLGNLFSALAVIISCLGLFGLSAFTAEQRRKEVGIRKVLGASVVNITTLLAREFIQPVLWAILLATPLALWALNTWLVTYEKHVDIHYGVFLVAGILAVVVALLTVSAQSIRAAWSNPGDILRTE